MSEQTFDILQCLAGMFYTATISLWVAGEYLSLRAQPLKQSDRRKLLALLFLFGLNVTVFAMVCASFAEIPIGKGQ